MQAEPDLSDDASRARALSRGFAVLVAVTVSLMVLGALVRAHGAGLACPDWPLCFGEVIPELDFKVAFEFGHRVLAGSVGLAFLALVFWTSRSPRLFRRERTTLLVAAVLLAVQILLGALTVWELLATWTVTSHLVTANLFVISLLWASLDLGQASRPPEPSPAAPAGTRTLLYASVVLLALQIVLGGLVSSSYAGMACPEWPACLNGDWFPSIGGNVRLHLLHRTNGYLLFAAILALSVASWSLPRLRGPALLLVVLTLLQVLVGISNVLLGIPVEVTAAHSFLAACMVLTLTTVTFRSRAGS